MSVINVEVVFDREQEVDVEFPLVVEVDAIFDRDIEVEVESDD